MQHRGIDLAKGYKEHVLSVSEVGRMTAAWRFGLHELGLNLKQKESVRVQQVEQHNRSAVSAQRQSTAQERSQLLLLLWSSRSAAESSSGVSITHVCLIKVMIKEA